MMKAVLNLFCLIISLNALGQSVDTVRKETATPFVIIDVKPINKGTKPLYIVDGIIYKGNVKKINPKDIVKVTVLKAPNSIKLYGEKGKYGVIFITTKAIGNLSHKNDSLTQYSGCCRDASSEELKAFFKFKDPILILDDKRLADSLSEKLNEIIKPEEIFQISVLRDSIPIYGPAGNGNVVVITSKKYALKKIKQKLGAFSNAYFNSHKNENDFTYVLNDKLLKGSINKQLEILYALSSKQIKSVKLLDDLKTPGLSCSVLIITTR